MRTAARWLPPTRARLRCRLRRRRSTPTPRLPPSGCAPPCRPRSAASSATGSPSSRCPDLTLTRGRLARGVHPAGGLRQQPVDDGFLRRHHRTGSGHGGNVDGDVISVNQGTGSATVATTPFAGTIISVNSATSITLSANLAATCTAAPYVYGTDDAAAVNAAVLAAAQWAVTTGNYKVQVIFQPALYMLGALVQSTTYGFSPFNTGLNYTYNTHIPVPVTLAAARKLIIDLISVGDASEPDFWGSAVPGVQGTCLVSGVFPPSQPDATFGQMSVIGTPATQANIGTGGVTNRRRRESRCHNPPHHAVPP